MPPGEEQAWELLAALDPAKVCLRAQARAGDAPSRYILRSFGQDVSVSVGDRSISSNSPIGDFLVNDLAHLSRLSILRYLIHSKPLLPSGHLISPGALPGGEIYMRGTHVLPLEPIAQAFSRDAERFLAMGGRLGGHRFEHGEAALQLFPFPRVPIVLALWAGDEEFAPDCRLLFDSTCPLQLPLDVIWSTAMMTAGIVLSDVTRRPVTGS